MPTPRLTVRASWKTVSPITTAVSGSRAPMMAVGVEPMMRTAIPIETSENTVGTMASINEYPHSRPVTSGMRCLSADVNENRTIDTAQTIST